MEMHRHKQSASTGNDRLYVNIAPELVKHAQDMRKIASIFYDTDGGKRTLTADQSRYNQNLSRILLTGGGGLALGGIAALVRSLKRPSVDHLATSGQSSYGGIEVAVPQRIRSVRRKPEEDEEDAVGEVDLAKAARDKTAPTGWLGDEAGQHTVTVPAMLAAGVGSFWTANALGDYIASRRRKRVREEAVEDAKDEYENAIADQFTDSKAASAGTSLTASLDNLYDDFEKISGYRSNINWPSVGDLIGGVKDDIVDLIPPGVIQSGKNVLGGYGGVLATLALATGVPASMLAYNYVRKQKNTRHPLNEAMRRRKAELSRRRPQPLYLTPGEEVVHEEDEQPAIETV